MSPIVTPEVRAAVLVAYARGDKVQAIEKQHSIARATIYWILEQADVTPDRVKRGARLVGDSQQMALLYDITQRQHERILELEAMLGIEQEQEEGDIS